MQCSSTFSGSNRKTRISPFYRTPILFTIRRSLVFVCSFVAFAHAVAEEPKKAAPLPIEQMRAVAYTKEFAKRFALPGPPAGTEPQGGVQAMEFAIETNPNAPYYYCKLYLYFDSNLPVAYPEEAIRGKDHIPSRRTRLMTFDTQTRWLRLSEQDRLHFGERQSRYTRMAVLTSPDYDYPENLKEVPNKPYGGVDMVYEEYHRSLFSGLAYLKVDMGCPAYSWVDKIDTGEIWLKREGGKDYRKQVRMERQDFLRFNLPPHFYRQIIQWTKQTAAYNQPLMGEEQRKTKRIKERQ